MTKYEVTKISWRYCRIVFGTMDNAKLKYQVTKYDVRIVE